MIDRLTASLCPRPGHALVRRALPGLLLALLLGPGLGCFGKTSDTVEGSQTHFLNCDVDADCQAVDPKLSCEAGRCTDSSAAPALPSAIGAPCITSEEASPYFSGATPGEVNIDDTGSCGAGLLCVASGFQGRVSCPDGQAAGSGGCLTTSGEPLLVPVAPQLELRPAQERVVCSCRCAGPGPRANFCSCPTGMRCDTLVPGPADNPYVGSYCVYPDENTL